MTVLHNKAPHLSLVGLHSEHHNCVDCGVNTAPGLPPRELAEFLMNRDGKLDSCFTADSEIYMVTEKVWKQTGLDGYGGCLCVGCLEKRIGRKLKPKDFQRGHAFNDPRFPCTERLRERRGD